MVGGPSEAGRVAEVVVTPGDKVAEGDPLVVITPAGR